MKELRNERIKELRNARIKELFFIPPFLHSYVSLFFILSFLHSLVPSFSQNVDSIDIILKSTSDQNERAVLLNDYTNRRINVNELNTAKKSAEKAFEIAKKAEFNFGKATALSLLGEIESKQHNFSPAYGYFNASEQIFLKDGDKADCAQLYLIWASCALLYKKPDDAIKYATSALNFYAYNSNTPFFESELHKVLGESWLQKNNESRALNEFDESLKLLVENTAPNSVKSKFAFDIGRTLLETKNYDDALTNFNAALSEDLILIDSDRIAFDRFNIANCHFKLHELNAASSNGEKSLHFFENKHDTLNTILSNLLLAEISLKEGSKTKAENYLKKTESLLSPWSTNSTNVYALKEIGRIFGKFGDKQKQHQYLLKYISAIDSASQRNGDIFTVDSDVEKSNLTFVQKLKTKIDAKYFIILLGLLSVITTVFFFTSTKKQNLEHRQDSEKILQSDVEPIAEEITGSLENNNLEIPHIENVPELTSSDLVSEEVEPVLVETFTKRKLQNGTKGLVDAFIESSVKLNMYGLLDMPAKIFKDDTGFIIDTKQQKQVDTLLENIFQAALINFEKPISFLKFSKSDVEPNSFVLKTIIELPKNIEKEVFFKSHLVSNKISNPFYSEFNFYISEFKKQVVLTNSKAFFANLVSSNYLILFTEIFDVSE